MTSDGDNKGGSKGGSKGGARGRGGKPSGGGKGAGAGGPRGRSGPGGKRPGGKPGAGRKAGSKPSRKPHRGSGRRSERPPNRAAQRDPANPGMTPDRATPSPPAADARLAEVEEIEVTVEKLIAGGDGLVRYEGIPLFVPRAAPGDRLRVRLTERRRDYGRAEIVEILEPGPGRREAPCPHFERCGGCDLQHLEDGLQTRLKAEAVVETLARLGGVKLGDPPTVRLSVHTAGHWGYRLRTQLHTRGGGPPQAVVAATVDSPTEPTEATEPAEPELPRVGYFARGSNDLVPISTCPILVPELESLIPGLPERLEEGSGGRLPRRLDLAAGGTAGVGPMRRDGAGAAPGGGAAASAVAGPVTGPVTMAPMVAGLPHGEIHLTVPLPEKDGSAAESYVYAYDARCFFQAHRDLIPKLVEVAVGDWTGESAYDLYAGVGLFALPLARHYATVTAVEGDAIAARYARRNANQNDAEGLSVEHLALESWIGQLPADADRVLVDPPRGGLTAPIRRALREARPARLTYVSCHPATLARDLRALADTYRLESLDLLEMFPQTGHMEVVAQLVRVDEA